jgi:hypothetical protein
MTNYGGETTVWQNNNCDNHYVGNVRNEKGQGWYGIIPDYDSTQRFLPTNLPDIFRENGLEGIFSGKIYERPESVGFIGIPLLLTGIEKEVIVIK